VFFQVFIALASCLTIAEFIKRKLSVAVARGGSSKVVPLRAIDDDIYYGTGVYNTSTV
jgi:hypothetical protein